MSYPTNPYKVLANYRGLAENEIAVGVDFSEMGKDAPEFFESEGKRYKRGLAMKRMVNITLL